MAAKVNRMGLPSVSRMREQSRLSAFFLVDRTEEGPSLSAMLGVLVSARARGVGRLLFPEWIGGTGKAGLLKLMFRLRLGSDIFR